LRHSRREDELSLIEQAIDCAGRGGDTARAFALRARAVEPMLIVRTIDAALALTERLMVDAATDEQRLQAQLARASTLLMASRFVDAAEVAGGARRGAARGSRARARRRAPQALAPTTAARRRPWNAAQGRAASRGPRPAAALQVRHRLWPRLGQAARWRKPSA
jgi:hypothetical protein